MKTVCEINKCAGCMACVDICPKGAIQVKDMLRNYNAVIDEEKCVNCNTCYKICQNNHPAEALRPAAWYQGWAEDCELREKCSSGGFANAVAQGFVKSGGVVYSCEFKNGQFIFSSADTVDELQKFVGSKYVKSNPIGVYKRIRSDLKEGKKVLFIGLPCQVSALKNFIGKKTDECLYTVDLICHGTPSPKLLDTFLKQYGHSLDSLNSIIFRVKAKMQIHGDNKGIITKGVSDKYTIAFLNSLSYTENCYSCTYARRERVSDLTIGDSWGNSLPVEEQRKGVSLALCQTDKGAALLEDADIHLEAVDLEKAIANNHQLEHPSVRHGRSSWFFDQIECGGKFNRLVFKCLPKQCLRQNMKELLLKLKIIRGIN